MSADLLYGSRVEQSALFLEKSGPVARPKKQKKRPSHINSLQRKKTLEVQPSFTLYLDGIMVLAFFGVSGDTIGLRMFTLFAFFTWDVVLAFVLGDAAAAPTFFRLVKNENRSICRRSRVISPATGSDPQRLQKFSWFPPARHAYGSKVKPRNWIVKHRKIEKSLSVAIDWNETGKTMRLRSMIFHLIFPQHPQLSPAWTAMPASAASSASSYLSRSSKAWRHKGLVATVVDWL